MSTDIAFKKYDSVQCIGFSLNTVFENNEYSGLDNTTDDWQNRVAFMKEAVESAHASNSINTDPNCLKIFMAPEFFFRGLIGAYDMETSSKITEELRNIVKYPKFDDWLFVFGTITAYSKQMDENSKLHEAYNYSFIQKGNSNESNSFVVLKEHKSGVDFKNNYSNPKNTNPNDLYSKNTNYLSPIEGFEKRTELKKFNYDSNSVFEVGGIQIGLDICVDNLYKRINHTNIPEDTQIDVHLLTACGVRKQKLTEKLSKNGIGFICDGSLKGSSNVIDFYSNNVKCLNTRNFHPSQNKVFRKMFYSPNAKINIFKPHCFENKLHKNKRDMDKPISI